MKDQRKARTEKIVEEIMGEISLNLKKSCTPTNPGRSTDPEKNTREGRAARKSTTRFPGSGTEPTFQWCTLCGHGQEDSGKHPQNAKRHFPRRILRTTKPPPKRKSRIETGNDVRFMTENRSFGNSPAADAHDMKRSSPFFRCRAASARRERTAARRNSEREEADMHE